MTNKMKAELLILNSEIKITRMKAQREILLENPKIEFTKFKQLVNEKMKKINNKAYQTLVNLFENSEET